MNSLSVQTCDGLIRILFSFWKTAWSIALSRGTSACTNPGTSTRWVSRTLATRFK